MNERAHERQRDQAAEAEAQRLAAEQIANAVKGIRFGSVEIVVHDGRIVQIERKEKLRLDK